jgi:CHAT domain-containing protein
MPFPTPKLHPWIRTILLFLISLTICLISPGWLANAFTSNSSHSPTIATTQPATELETQAKNAYRNQDYPTAAKLFQQAATLYQTHKAPFQQSISLGNLSLSHQQLNQWEQAKTAIQTAIQILNNLPTSPAQSAALAQALETQGSLYLTLGQPEPALIALEQASKRYQQLKQPNRQLTTQTRQAQALQQLGAIRRAIGLLQTALNLPEATNPQFTTAITQTQGTPETIPALRLLGELHQTAGNRPAAQSASTQSLKLAQQLNLPTEIALSQIQLGDLAQDQIQVALDYYQQAETTPTAHLRLQAQTQQLNLYIKAKRWPEAQSLSQTIQRQLPTSPISRSQIEQQIRITQLIAQLPTIAPETLQLASRSLENAIPPTKAFNDPRLESYLLGSLGRLAEHQQQWDTARTFTQQAIQLVQMLNMPDVNYRWQWQLGRILKAQKQPQPATQAYQAALSEIKLLRNDLNASSLDSQFSFRSVIEPIHRQLVELLLQPDRPENLQANLQKAREAIEGLQSAELNNFFREACLNEIAVKLEEIDPKAAIIYPILLEGQLTVITSLPTANQDKKREFQYHTTPVSRDQINDAISNFRAYLLSPQDNNYQETLLPELQQMYNWLLRDTIADLDKQPIETLAFVLDGALRNLPVAALHDGKNFLVEKYGIAISPGLQIPASGTSKQPSTALAKPRILGAGIAESRFQFDPLNFVKQELASIQQLQFPNTILFNQDFTSQSLQQNSVAAPYKIVHLATHGQFSEKADETFIVAWDRKINVNELSDLLKNTELSRTQSLELLILSACQTAEGDDRAALGLAGMAIRSGARSTLATLWTVDDQASATLIQKFYEEIAKTGNDRPSKAEALRRAQRTFLDPNSPTYNPHPKYWAAYTLVGDWTWQ